MLKIRKHKTQKRYTTHKNTYASKLETLRRKQVRRDKYTTK